MKEHASIFVETIERETRRSAQSDDERDATAEARLRVLESEIADPPRSLLSGMASPILAAILADCEAEKAEIGARLSTAARPSQRWPFRL
jgi:hypothetical protein